MKRLRTAIAACVLTAATAVGALVVQPTATAATFPNGKDPVIFVHGYSRGTGDWDVMVARFRAAGYTDSQLVLFGYNTTTQSNVRTAELLGQRVEQVLASTGASKVDIVSHSMGSLNSRYCVKFTGCAGRVDDWISISGNNNGTNTARWCTFYITCREMVPGSALLTKLNSGSALPVGVQGVVYWTRDDQVISPPTSSILPGLAAVEVTGVTHLNIVKNDRVIAAVLGAVA